MVDNMENERIKTLIQHTIEGKTAKIQKYLQMQAELLRKVESALGDIKLNSEIKISRH